ncbi:hypothetical protein A4A49_02809 [Nicotiana attenuata]|uniref:Uncharacterized protein n=1 Tax=Nicotiana attenuata TaxID=49451 RepID=A0A314LAH8_NICAT|nr:hypothetical protein A4A49_02809 [Nicotiana attenuata]
MAGPGSSMLYSFLLFIATLSLQEVYRGKLASSELYTILGGFTSSLIFILLLTFIGNYQETCGVRSGWGAVILAEVVALIAASTVHRVCITTCFLFSAALLYEVNKLSGLMVSRSESRGKSYVIRGLLDLIILVVLLNNLRVDMMSFVVKFPNVVVFM